MIFCMAVQSFYQQVYEVVKLIPRGKVMSYGGVARQCGHPGLARTVGYALHSLQPGARVPWWRVINSAGRISIPGAEASDTQRRKLLAEGVVVDAETLRVDMRAYDAETKVYENLRRRHAGAAKRRARLPDA